jgi:polysaccharide biosynthesis protein PslH
VLPNGVDLQYFTPDEQVQRRADTIVVSGKMSYHANVSMVWYLVEKIMPLIWSQMPEIKLVIVGKDPPKKISALAQHPNIQVTGFVPDIRSFLRSAAIAVAPLTYGAGIQNKVLEAMACGTPVVTTRKAVSALQVIPGQDLLVAEDQGNFANHVISLLVNPTRRAEMAENGICYVQKHHNWENISGRLSQIYAEVIRQAG